MVRNMRPGVMATLNLFLETPAAPDVDLPPIRPKTDIMLFFKHYMPSKEHPTLEYVGRRLVPKDSKVKVRAVCCMGARREERLIGRDKGPWLAGRVRMVRAWCSGPSG